MSSVHSIKMEPKYRVIVALVGVVACFIFYTLFFRLFHSGGYYMGGNFGLILAIAVGAGIYIGFRNTYELSAETFTWKAGARKFAFSTTGADLKFEKVTGFTSFMLTFLPTTYRILAEGDGKKRKIVLYLSEADSRDLVSRIEAYRGAPLERVGGA